MLLATSFSQRGYDIDRLFIVVFFFFLVAFDRALLLFLAAHHGNAYNVVYNLQANTLLRP
jgi:hypothetical protein